MYVQERARVFLVDWNRWINVACPNLSGPEVLVIKECAFPSYDFMKCSSLLE